MVLGTFCIGSAYPILVADDEEEPQAKTAEQLENRIQRCTQSDSVRRWVKEWAKINPVAIVLST